MAAGAKFWRFSLTLGMYVILECVYWCMNRVRGNVGASSCGNTDLMNVCMGFYLEDCGIALMYNGFSLSWICELNELGQIY